MNQASMIVSVMAVVACLFLATRSANIRQLGTRRALRLAMIWIAIIVGLVFAIHFAGLQNAS